MNQQLQNLETIFGGVFGVIADPRQRTVSALGGRRLALSRPGESDRGAEARLAAAVAACAGRWTEWRLPCPGRRTCSTASTVGCGASIRARLILSAKSDDIFDLEHRIKALERVRRGILLTGGRGMSVPLTSGPPRGRAFPTGEKAGKPPWRPLRFAIRNRPRGTLIARRSTG